MRDTPQARNRAKILMPIKEKISRGKIDIFEILFPESSALQLPVVTYCHFVFPITFHVVHLANITFIFKHFPKTVLAIGRLLGSR